MEWTSRRRRRAVAVEAAAARAAARAVDVAGPRRRAPERARSRAARRRLRVDDGRVAVRGRDRRRGPRSADGAFLDAADRRAPRPPLRPRGAPRGRQSACSRRRRRPRPPRRRRAAPPGAADGRRHSHRGPAASRSRVPSQARAWNQGTWTEEARRLWDGEAPPSTAEHARSSPRTCLTPRGEPPARAWEGKG